LVAAVENPDGTFTLPGAAVLKKGAALVFDAKTRGPVVVFVTTAGKLEALSARCTHNGCTVEFVPSGRERLHCPCHNSLFDEKGKVLGGPAPLPLTCFAVSTKGPDAVVVVPA
jgi:cytochrome b6-f complex iron-sulfur subunit